MAEEGHFNFDRGSHSQFKVWALYLPFLTIHFPIIESHIESIYSSTSSLSMNKWQYELCAISCWFWLYWHIYRKETHLWFEIQDLWIFPFKAQEFDTSRTPWSMILYESYLGSWVGLGHTKLVDIRRKEVSYIAITNIWFGTWSPIVWDVGQVLLADCTISRMGCRLIFVWLYLHFPVLFCYIVNGFLIVWICTI